MADISSIKLFHSMLTPIMEAIPQVVEMMEKKADMDRSMAKYQKDLDKAQKEVQDVYDAADQRLIQMNGGLVDLQNTQEALRAEIERTRVKLAADQEAAADVANSAKFASDAAVIEHNARANQAELQAKERIAVAEASVSARTAELEKSIADLEKREAAAQKALDTLRNKLG
jgi:chromosome segregation ATPase